MRAVILFIASLGLATPAEGRPLWTHLALPQTPRAVDLTGSTPLGEITTTESPDAPIPRDAGLARTSSSINMPQLRIGPFTAEIGGSVGGHPQLASYRLEGAAVLGSNISGSVDGRGARINLIWPMGH